jgi:hypothetical protein
MNPVDNGFLLSLSLSLSLTLNTRRQNFKVKPESPNCRVEADWLKMRRATNFSYSVSHLTSILLYDPRTPATTVAKRRAKGRY